MRKSRIAVVNSHPIQYFAPLYAYLSADDHLDITALYLSDASLRGARDPGFGVDVKWDVDLLAGYDAVFVDEKVRSRMPTGFFSLVAPAIWRRVREGGYDALWSHGHGYGANLIAIAAARSVGMPVFMRCETHLGLNPPGLGLRLKRLLRRPLLGLFYGLFVDRFLAIGSANAAFYRAMGVPERKIFKVPYTVDNRRFMAAENRDPARRRAARETLGVHDDAPIVLFAAKLSQRKHPDDLIRAAAVLADEKIAFHLVIVGAGEEEATLKALVAEHGLTNVTFPGFVNQAALAGVYSACEVFVLPSNDEPWGLAVNEAMAAGLPIVAASGVGCVPDLVIDGRNGASFPVGDVAALAAALRPILVDAQLRADMARASVEIISRWSYEQCRQGLQAALDSLPESR